MRDIREKAGAYLDRGMRSRKELSDHLAKAGYPREDIDLLVEELEDLGYISDESYAESFVSYGRGKGWGRERIIRELARKGISRDLALEALEDLGEEETGEFDRAMRVAEGILAAGGIEKGEPVPEKIKARIARRLASYGYSSSLIYSLLGRLWDS